ncbi:MAG: nuclear transport factor 2 family protein [Solirubrobacterales bacterium]|nr:nuclear transport factor 2 family protein [Solirubrobacterales bacterium]MBV9944361.1 nuclear transport factor 2 family protein [Solirubrobacterales bacterium]
MATQATTTSFDLARFCRALERRDSATQLSMYAPHATVTIADRITQPGSPRVLHGAGEIRGWIEDVDGREMTHAVGHTGADEHGAAFTEPANTPTAPTCGARPCSSLTAV